MIDTRDPLSTDDSTQGRVFGERWHRTDTGGVFVAHSILPGAAVWADPLAYAADIGPVLPSLVYSTARLRAIYTGHCAAVWRSVPDVTQTVLGFVGDTLNTAALDAFLGPDDGDLTTLFDQTGGGYHASQWQAEAPKIRHLHMGGHRTAIFQGGSQSGAMYSLSIPHTIGNLGIAANNLTVVAVVQPSSVIARNHALPLVLNKGTLLDLAFDNGYLRLIQDGGEAVQGWGVEGGGCDWVAPDMPCETTPSVLALRIGNGSVSLRQNEGERTAGTMPALTGFASIGAIGKKLLSTPGGNSECYEGRLSALLIYNQRLDDRQLDQVVMSLYRRFKIAPQRHTRTVAWMGDSIPAGFLCLGLNGFEKQSQALLPPARHLNFAVAGCTVTQQPGAPFYGYNAGQFDTMIGPYLDERAVLVIASAGGNDGVIQPTPPSPAAVHQGIAGIVSRARALNVAAVVVGTVLPRLGQPQAWINELNGLIRNGAGDYVLCDVAADPDLSAPLPQPHYADLGHPSELGHARAATLYAQVIGPLLQ